MFDKTLFPASRLRGLMEMGERKWLELSPEISQKEISQGPSRSLYLGDSIMCGM